MHKPLLLLTLFSVMLVTVTGCSENQTSKENSLHPTSVPVAQTSQPVVPATFSKTFSGSIDGKLGITMSLSRNGNELSGYYFYNKVKKPITIHGTIDPDNVLTLEETDEKGTVTGIFEGTLYSDVELTGTWRNPNSNRQLSFSLKEANKATGSSGIEVTEYSFSIKHKDGMEADFSLPVVKGNLDATILNKINKKLSLHSLFEETEAEVKKTFAECACGMINSQYTVNYNKHSVLSITVVAEWLGAYSSFNEEYININILTGEPIKIEQLLKTSSLDELAKRANQILQERIAETKKEVAGTDGEEWADELLADKKFEKEHLQNFTVNEKGITFYYRFGFPHAALALEPDGAISFTFEQLSNYIDPNGLLAMENR